MNIQSMLEKKKLTMYALAKLSGVPKTTVIDICTGKSSIEGCNAKTVYKLSKVLGCSMEELMTIDNSKYEYKTGLPKDKTYLEKGLPQFLQDSIRNMEKSWEIEDSGERDMHWDIYWCDLYSDINFAEVDQLISSEQAGYLRKKYLRMNRENN